MKKTLLTSALAVMALAASAQSQVASPAGEFEFVTKNLTVGGKTIPTSMVRDNENDKYDFTIYNSSFNEERKFSLPMKKYAFTVNILEAQAPLTIVKTLFKNEYGNRGEVQWIDQSTGNLKTISTFDDWKSYVNETYGQDVVAFIDADGNFAFHKNSDGWSQLEGTQEDGLVIRQVYSYYYKEKNEIIDCSSEVLATVNTDNLTWTKTSSEEGSVTSELLDSYLTDYDANCAESFDSYLTQGLFNKDEKFEVVMKAYKVADDADDNDGGYNQVSSAYPYEIASVDGDKITLRKREQDKYYKSYISIVNEDGQEILSLPEESGHDAEFAKVDGKLYMMVEAYKDGQEQTIIYSVDNVNTSITELARTRAVKSTKTFNMAGMQVGKDAKGIVIQQGGKKYLNK